MSNIDKQALREAADAANETSWGRWESYHPHKGARGYEVKVGVKAIAQHGLKVDSVFIAAANPATVLALLDELEAAEKLIAEFESDKSRMMDALHAAVALNSAGISLNDFDECVLRLHEWGALPDYCIALYVDFIHGFVSESKLLDFGYINDHGAFSARQAEKRIAELEAQRFSFSDSKLLSLATDIVENLVDTGASDQEYTQQYVDWTSKRIRAAGIGKGE